METSGVADAEPLAQSLAKQGFRLDCIVAVVDADAGLAALEQPVAVAQVRMRHVQLMLQYPFHACVCLLIAVPWATPVTLLVPLTHAGTCS